MTFDYNKSRATAERLITKFGQSGEFVLSGDTGGYDDFGNPLPAQPDVVISGIVTPLLDFGTDTKKASYESSGLNIIAGDKYCFFHSETAPEVGYEHTQNGVAYRMVAMMKELTSVDGINTFRKIQLRR